MMKYIPIIISSLALLLSFLTFYWSQLRVKHKLHLVRIDKIGEFMNPQIALVNNGTRDLLITSVRGRFEHADKQGSSTPAQRVEIGEGPSMLLSSRKAVQCKISFTESFTKNFVEHGKLRKGDSPEIYELAFYIDVEWVDSHAESRSSSSKIAKYGFNKDGKIMLFSPLTGKHDLYKKS